jgi:hypothetical protein
MGLRAGHGNGKIALEQHQCPAKMLNLVFVVSHFNTSEQVKTLRYCYFR